MVAVKSRPSRRAVAGLVAALAMTRALQASRLAGATSTTIFTGKASITVASSIVAQSITAAVVGAAAQGAINVCPALVALAGQVHACAMARAAVEAGGD